MSAAATAVMDSNNRYRQYPVRLCANDTTRHSDLLCHLSKQSHSESGTIDTA